MKKTSQFLLAGVSLMLLFTACKKNDSPVEEGITQAERNKISALGFTSSTAYKADGGYIVEGDIFLSETDLNSVPEDTKFLRVGDEEQYRTTNLVSGLPRTLRVRYTGTTASISAAVDAAIARYNALPSTYSLRFTRVSSTSTADITVSNVSGVSYIAAAGFPSGGNPFNSVRFNTAFAGWTANTLASVMAHEMGHCIGFRHTDYANRAFSCGGSAFNEGSAGVGAILIPGTPAGPDPNSWMLACIGNGINRPFNTNDRTALDFLY
jgi:hypothetical protein